MLYFVLQCRFAGLVLRLIGASEHLVFFYEGENRTAKLAQIASKRTQHTAIT